MRSYDEADKAAESYLVQGTEDQVEIRRMTILGATAFKTKQQVKSKRRFRSAEHYQIEKILRRMIATGLISMEEANGQA